jgi:hypothetical protein
MGGVVCDSIGSGLVGLGVMRLGFLDAGVGSELGDGFEPDSDDWTGLGLTAAGVGLTLDKAAFFGA